ncbi:hypothetical protein CR152_21380 [Massilia violaceinigra]|uniref:Uncharacterized protein n=1 Tax=Massilia violaceinigra TaxID=2045208 RepID=A0A2D2DP70_9BURK|nr:DUF6506 family protein [Massilia violaceinigra]ATQ76783.1 hypothetical protein CR152_21380 [Massilia violaceinigra]
MIIKGPGYAPAVHRASLNSPAFSTTIVCVSHFEEAISVAIDLQQSGIQLIELCGGFTQDEAASIHRSVDMQIPVGVVRYTPEQQEPLAQLFMPSSPA